MSTDTSTRTPTHTEDGIRLEGVRVHNLKSVSVTIPLGKLVLVTGVSGSGKSSLAFDTLYAEGRRRFVEAFSPQVRRLLDRFEQPDADMIGPLPPVIAVRQENEPPGRRATVATATEVLDFLALVFARIGKIACPECGRPIRRDTPETILDRLAELPDGVRYQIGFPLPARYTEDDGSGQSPWEKLAADGFTRVLADGRMHLLPDAALPDDAAADAVVIVDRLTTGQAGRRRVRDSLEIAFHSGEGTALVLLATDAGIAGADAVTIDGRTWHRLTFRGDLRCGHCGTLFPEPTPRLFDYRTRLGGCPICRGAGVVSERNGPETICHGCGGVRWNPAALSVRVGGRNVAELCGMTPGDLAAHLDALTQSPSGEGVAGAGLSAAKEAPVSAGRVFEAAPRARRGFTPSGRSNPGHPLRDSDRAVLAEPLDEIRRRLDELVAAGLTYLTLDRPLRTLSTGEARRVTLTAVLGSPLVDSLYVLDEPSAGLHPRDVERLVAAVRRLRDLGNTVVVVEHKPEFYEAADYLIELGPGAGPDGGEIVLAAKPPQSGKRKAESGRIPDPNAGTPPSSGFPLSAFRFPLTLRGARAHNLKNVSVEFPLGVLCAVCGVSGAGKSSLVIDTLYPALRAALGQPVDRPPECDGLDGVEQIDDVVLADAAPVSRSPRSNPVTVLKAFAEIRAVFAETPEARLRQFTPKHFSFNAAGGGRCPRCRGAGEIAVDMQFLPDVQVTCPECEGTRYRREILEVTYRGLSIAEVLALSAREAFAFFRTHPSVQRRLGVLRDVGLDYLTLGQPVHTLSGGEAQRLRLAVALSAGTKSRTLFLIDEPTLGLHPTDVDRLIACFRSLQAVGHSVIAIEHNPHFLRQADYLIELGPGAGEDGGQVIAAGPPES